MKRLARVAADDFSARHRLFYDDNPLPYPVVIPLGTVLCEACPCPLQVGPKAKVCDTCSCHATWRRFVL
jgi:hypothetical protein